jgi:hypothetical protein
MGEQSFAESPMKIHYTIATAIATLAEVAVGAFGVQGLQAQSTPKAYVISEITIVDQAGPRGISPKGFRGD